jgi:hypothetical protein
MNTNAFEVVARACKYLIKNKGAQIFVEQATGEVEDWPSVINQGNWNLKISMPTKIIYNVTLRLEHNYHVDCVFDEEDFDISKELPIDSIAHLEELKPEDRLTGRWIFILWNLHQLLTNKRRVDPDSEVDNYIFYKTRTIKQTL